MNQTAKKRIDFTSFRIGKMMAILSVGLMMSIGAYAQDDNGLEDPDMPFDGGISLLAVAGVAYGVKQWRDTRSKKSNEQSSEL